MPVLRARELNAIEVDCWVIMPSTTEESLVRIGETFPIAAQYNRLCGTYACSTTMDDAAKGQLSREGDLIHNYSTSTGE